MTGGRIFLDGEDVSKLSIADRIAQGPGAGARGPAARRTGADHVGGPNLSLASIGAFVRGLLLSRPRERATRSASRSATSTSRPQARKRADRLAVRRQPAEGGHRQDAGDRPQGDPAGRAQPRHRRRRQGRGVPPARRTRRAGPRRGVLDLGSRRVPEHRAPHHRDAPRQDIGANSDPTSPRKQIMAASGEAVVVGSIKKSGALTMTDSQSQPQAHAAWPIARRRRLWPAAARRPRVLRADRDHRRLLVPVAQLFHDRATS